jgi:hypothetical protein
MRGGAEESSGGLIVESKELVGRVAGVEGDADNSGRNVTESGNSAGLRQLGLSARTRAGKELSSRVIEESDGVS